MVFINHDLHGHLDEWTLPVVLAYISRSASSEVIVAGRANVGGSGEGFISVVGKGQRAK
jgi:GTP-binding protein EngB required for normal cell division